ncbi:MULTISPECIES: Arm DNA-binding domain-containing protein [unclassified Endozoicomonas]|uniref:Arm DNA-binding domain-containing protein n=1 Tax=unclassified Endozoicomonas TaxID=2644528 RepID=UPI0021485852|nr:MULTISPECIES: DUF3596 domain-containing protein [unclassified Endozoicomonas]
MFVQIRFHLFPSVSQLHEFRYKGRMCREELGLAPTKNNIDYASGFEATIL